MNKELAAPYRNGHLVASSLYLARDDEIYLGRPILTGDVFSDVSTETSPDASPKMVIVLQHPCSMRSNGAEMRSRILVAQLDKDKEWGESDWQRFYPKMALPLLGPEIKEGKTWVANFNKLHVVPSKNLKHRIACLAPHGINILLQRWVHYSSRVIVPTEKFQEVTEPFLEETDLVERWCDSFGAETPSEIQRLTSDCISWLREDNGRGITRQNMLKNPQERSTVRREMIRHLKNLGSNATII